MATSIECMSYTDGECRGKVIVAKKAKQRFGHFEMEATGKYMKSVTNSEDRPPQNQWELSKT